MNKACLEFWGYSEEKEIIGRNVSEFPECHDLVNKATPIIQKENVYIGEDTVVKKDRIPIDFQISANLVTTPDGKPFCIMANLVDITEKKRTQEALNESQERFNRLINQLNDLVWRATVDGSKVLDINKSFERIYGISATEFNSNPELWIEMVHPDDREIAEESARELLRTGNSNKFIVNMSYIIT